LIYETDRDNFASLMNVTWQSCKRGKPDRDTMRYWFNKLADFDFYVVAKAFDTWLMTQDELPSYHQIRSLCQPKIPVYAALEKKADIEANRKNVKELTEFVAEKIKPKTNMRHWAKKILKEPSAYPDISVKYARETMKL